MSQRFLYHASALALGGQIRRPWDEPLPSQAATVLPTVGGLGQAEVRDYDYRGVISLRYAKSTVMGNEGRRGSRRVFNTLSTVTLEGLDIGGVVTAERIVARLASEKIEGGDEIPIRPVGSYFEGLRIAGTLIELEPWGSMFGAATLEAMAASQRGGPVDAEGHSLKLPGDLSHRKPAGDGLPAHFEDHQIVTSLFQPPGELPAGCPREAKLDGQKIPPWSIRVPGFGTVFLGELMISRYARRLSMVRVEMGSPTDGTLVAGGTEGNGSTYP